jgi:hypothetical protein
MIGNMKKTKLQYKLFQITASQVVGKLYGGGVEAEGGRQVVIHCCREF